MSHDIQKYIQINGCPRDIAVIYRHAVNIMDCEIPTPANDKYRDLGRFVEIFGGDRGEVIDCHGYSEIESVDFDDLGREMTITVVTPYGNLQDFMAWIRKRFPSCIFLCLKEDEDCDLVINEID